MPQHFPSPNGRDPRLGGPPYRISRAARQSTGPAPCRRFGSLGGRARTCRKGLPARLQPRPPGPARLRPGELRRRAPESSFRSSAPAQQPAVRQRHAVALQSPVPRRSESARSGRESDLAGRMSRLPAPSCDWSGFAPQPSRLLPLAARPGTRGRCEAIAERCEGASVGAILSDDKAHGAGNTGRERPYSVWCSDLGHVNENRGRAESGDYTRSVYSTLGRPCPFRAGRLLGGSLPGLPEPPRKSLASIITQ